jgi:predicted Zn-dependent protease with MMP-like domain
MSHLSEPVRREIFSALVEAQDQEMPVAESRHEIGRRYGISEEDLRAIEREGLDNDWPPFED